MCPIIIKNIILTFNWHSASFQITNLFQQLPESLLLQITILFQQLIDTVSHF